MIPNIDNLKLLSVTEGLRLDENAPREEIIHAIVYERALILRIPFGDSAELTLKLIEAIYKSEAIKQFGLASEATWSDIGREYLFRFYESIKGMNDNEKREAIIQELRRHSLAKWLQLNKFTASAKMVIAELERLKVTVEG